MRRTELPGPKLMKKAQSNTSGADQQRRELLALLESRNSGAKLSLFADWAAGRDPGQVEKALRTLDPPTPAASTPTKPKAKLYVLPRRSS